jgi:adenylate cyclase
MSRSPRSVPFSVTLLTLMGLIVLPLASALLWLGWRSVDYLEENSVQQRIGALNVGVSTFLTDGLRIILSVGSTLAEQPLFAAEAGSASDDERRRQLVGVLRRHPNFAAAYVGYPDGRFLYAGRVSLMAAAQRTALGGPDPGAIIVRTIAGFEPERRETWRFVAPDGTTSDEHSAPSDFDPRARSWYALAVQEQKPALTEPYRFAQSNEPGISAGVPIRGGGVLGFDFTLGTLAHLLGDYKATPNAIVILAAGSSEVLVETAPCQAADPDCFADDGEARAALRKAVAGVASGDGRLDREVTANGRRYRLIGRLMPPQLGRPFAIASALPVVELAEASNTLLEREAILAAVAVGLAILAAFLVSLLLSRAIHRIAAKTERIRDLDFSDTMPVRSRITEVQQLSASIERLREGLQVFGRYVSKNLVTQIMRSPHTAGVGGVRRELTVMFTDIQSFSLLSENIEPELLTSRLSRYFEAVGSAISSNRGMIDKYIGDAVMAFWNAPEPDPDHVAHACHAALEAAAASRQLAGKWTERGRPAFRTRIGVHTGPAVVGNVGARERINYTLVGAVANQASRLEGLNKVYGTEILASGEVMAATATRFVWRPIDRIVAAGTTEVMEIYEPLGTRSADGQDDRHTAFMQVWEHALAAYRARRFAEAIHLFEKAAALRAGDGPARVFLQRCKQFEAGEVPPNWDGTWHFDRK